MSFRRYTYSAFQRSNLFMPINTQYESFLSKQPSRMLWHATTIFFSLDHFSKYWHLFKSFRENFEHNEQHNQIHNCLPCCINRPILYTFLQNRQVSQIYNQGILGYYCQIPLHPSTPDGEQFTHPEQAQQPDAVKPSAVVKIRKSLESICIYRLSKNHRTQQSENSSDGKLYLPTHPRGQPFEKIRQSHSQHKIRKIKAKPSTLYSRLHLTGSDGKFQKQYPHKRNCGESHWSFFTYNPKRVGKYEKDAIREKEPCHWQDSSHVETQCNIFP